MIEPLMPKAALVTGAAKRVGRVLALALARTGFDIALHYGRSEREAMATAEEIRALGRRVVTLCADLERLEEVERIVPAAAEALGPLGLLVNNASIFELDRIRTMSESSWSRHLAINLTAPTFLCRAFVRALPERAHGLVVNILDERIFNPTPNYLSYTASRFGLWGVTQVLARELAPRIRVNAIGPGPTLPEAGMTEADFAALCARMPLKRGSSPEELADALLFLLRARSMTGQMITLDGGQQLGWLTPGGPESE
ncbi:MAG: SDR family oxidoreductase [Geminicoccaceae bacterium]|nr:SDR family oxidoreductase [Geminicoccaceae bacterium]MCX8101983.1 SDR family oxidoreductase [Geminicoccaceae bacterium]